MEVMEISPPGPVITYNMLISYQRENDNVKIPLNSSEVNVSTLELHDPYTVNPDLSPGVSHVSLCHVSSINMSLCHVIQHWEQKISLMPLYFIHQVFMACSLYLIIVGVLGFIMNSIVFWLYWKNKKVLYIFREFM